MKGKYQRILRIDRGQSFKGHQAELSIDTLNNKMLSLHNQYYSGSIGFYYDLKKNKTIKKLHTGVITPKWLEKLYNNAVSLTSSKRHYSPEFLFRDRNGISVYVNAYQITATKEETVEGCGFQGHRDNIDELKELSKSVKSIRKYLKSKTKEEVVKYIHHYNDNYDNDDVQTIPLYSKAIKYIKETVARLFVWVGR